MITIDAHSYFYKKDKKPLMNSSSGGEVSVTTVEYGTSNTNTTISPNTLHKWDEVTELTLTLGAETPGIVNEYLIQFTSGATPTVLTLPEDIKWASELKIKADTVYQISIVDNLAVFAEFSNSNVPHIIIDLNEMSYDTMSGGVSVDFSNSDLLDPLKEYIENNMHSGEDVDLYVISVGGLDIIDEFGTLVILGIVSSSPLITIIFPQEAELDPVDLYCTIPWGYFHPYANTNSFAFFGEEPILAVYDFDEKWFEMWL